MITTIRDILGPRWYERKIYDDNSLSYGGLSKEEETLGEFVNDTEINAYEDSAMDLQIALKKCGIKQIEEIDMYFEDIIKEKIENIEDELGIVIDFTWDYYYD